MKNSASHSWIPSTVLLLGCGATSLAPAASAPSIETAKQVLDQKWQKLKPDGMTERNVLFQDVRAGAVNAGSYPFRVTAIIRDYGPGYPRNGYYGETCVARIEGETYTLWAGATGWQVDGRMTPDLSAKKCQKNPVAGVSSMPLQTLPGTPAPSGPIASAGPQRSGGLVEGPYTCWSNGQSRPLLNFTIRGSGQYVGADGSAGTFTFDPASSRVTFKGGPLGDLGHGFSTIYYEPQGRPTVSIRGASGAEAAFCQKE